MRSPRSGAGAPVPCLLSVVGKQPSGARLGGGSQAVAPHWSGEAKQMQMLKVVPSSRRVHRAPHRQPRGKRQPDGPGRLLAEDK